MRDVLPVWDFPRFFRYFSRSSLFLAPAASSAMTKFTAGHSSRGPCLGVTGAQAHPYSADGSSWARGTDRGATSNVPDHGFGAIGRNHDVGISSSVGAGCRTV